MLYYIHNQKKETLCLNQKGAEEAHQEDRKVPQMRQVKQATLPVETEEIILQDLLETNKNKIPGSMVKTLLTLK